eukprot:TRINITY_DN3362_c0_g3_i2.p1 TRINITY_DN3362_c0_g3~~TRINITY_DN3362_c0_g3_i2.p1  ORF type:complete len:504 (-),score=125.19 TRINITY_DN3362_c0_g3_i2:97-1608(-)
MSSSNSSSSTSPSPSSFSSSLSTTASATSSSSSSSSSSSTLVTPSPSPSPGVDESAVSINPSVHLKKLTLIPDVFVRQSSLDVACETYQEDVTQHLDELKNAKKQIKPKALDFQNCVFVGHKSADLDSIASAIGAADLFDGIPLRASELNSESKFALEHWKLPTPDLFDMKQIKSSVGICLVDHNQVSQVADGLDLNRVKGVVDHHALQSNMIVSSLPITIDIRPWGSASSLITYHYIDQLKQIKPEIAGMLLSGILSDTLNLQSPTVTEMDRLAVSLLSKLADVKDVNELSRLQFRAKSKDIISLPGHAIIRGDLKTFEFKLKSGIILVIAFGVFETVDTDSLIARKEELENELRYLQLEYEDERKGDEDKKSTAVVYVSFLALVNIEKLHSYLIFCDDVGKSLAEAAFEIKSANGMIDLGKRVSRKKDFIPPLASTIRSGFVPSATSKSNKKRPMIGKLVEVMTDKGHVWLREGPVRHLFELMPTLIWGDMKKVMSTPTKS